MKGKILLGILFLSFIGSITLISRTIQETQSIDASQRNQIDSTGGGGGSGDVSSSGNNAFTGNNTHTGSETFYGSFLITNAFTQFNSASTGPMLVGTNVDFDVNAIAVFRKNGARNNIGLFGDAVTFFIGDTFSANYGYWQHNGTDMNFAVIGAGATRFKRGSTDFMIIDSGGWTLGNNSSYQNVFVGNTFTAANGANWNSGVFNIPAAGGTVSNNTSFVSLNNIQGSNVVATTTDGTFRMSSGTNMTGIIDVNNGAGTLQTKAMFTASTNTPAGINPTSNVINTNGNQRLFVNISVAYGANSGTFLWTSTAQGPKNRFFTPTAGITNFVSGWVQPNAIWTISNYVGTATCIPGEGHLETH